MLQPPPKWLRAPARTTREHRLPRVSPPHQIQGYQHRFQSPLQGPEQLRRRSLGHQHPHQLLRLSHNVAAREEGRKDGRPQRKHSRCPCCLSERRACNHEIIFLLSSAKAMAYGV